MTNLIFIFYFYIIYSLSSFVLNCNFKFIFSKSLIYFKMKKIKLFNITNKFNFNKNQIYTIFHFFLPLE